MVFTIPSFLSIGGDTDLLSKPTFASGSDQLFSSEPSLASTALDCGPGPLTSERARTIDNAGSPSRGWLARSPRVYWTPRLQMTLQHWIRHPNWTLLIWKSVHYKRLLTPLFSVDT